jgi:hypothetical protein
VELGGDTGKVKGPGTPEVDFLERAGNFRVVVFMIVDDLSGRGDGGGGLRG